MTIRSLRHIKYMHLIIPHAINTCFNRTPFGRVQMRWKIAILMLHFCAFITAIKSCFVKKSKYKHVKRSKQKNNERP